MNVSEYQTRLIETQKLHIKACQETTTLKRELDELKTQLKMQQRRLEYEARKSMLEEHKTALMLLRGRRIADGGCASRTKSPAVVNSDQTQSRSLKLPTSLATSSSDSSPETTSPGMLRSPDYANLELEKSDLNTEKVRLEVTSFSETKPAQSFEVPAMVSVGTSTDDLHELGGDATFAGEDEQKGEVQEGNHWNIRENLPSREEAEGCSRSVSPYTAEKRSYATIQGPKEKIIYPLDEEVSEISKSKSNRAF